MNKIYTAKFGEQAVRFVLPTGSKDIFVCKDDIRHLLQSCCTYAMMSHFKQIFDEAINQFTDQTDRRSAVVDVETTGLVVHSHAMSGIYTNTTRATINAQY